MPRREREILEHAVRAGAEPTYAGRVVKVAVLLVCLGMLAPGCGEPEPTIVYHFEVRGTGDNVREDQHLDLLLEVAAP